MKVRVRELNSKERKKKEREIYQKNLLKLVRHFYNKQSIER